MEDFKLFFNVDEYDILTIFEHINFTMQCPEIKSIFLHDGDQIKDPQRLMYFKNPEPRLRALNLKEGFTDYIFQKCNANMGQLSDMEQYNVRTNIYNLKHGSKGKRKIYARRTVLDFIMIIPYHRQPFLTEAFSLCITKFDDVIYIVKRYPSIKQRRLRNDTYFFKFQQFCFSESPETEPNTQIPVDENKFLFCTYRTGLENFEFLLFDKLPGIIANEEIKDITNLEDVNKCRFVLTKLLWQKKPTDNRDWRYHPKMMSWWIESSLLNVSDIYVGFKDPKGYVRHPIEHLSVKDMPEKTKWKPQVCLGFLNQFLALVDEQMYNVNCPYTVYEYRFFHSEDCFKYKIHGGKTEFTFLTEEFIKECSTQKNE